MCLFTLEINILLVIFNHTAKHVLVPEMWKRKTNKSKLSSSLVFAQKKRPHKKIQLQKADNKAHIFCVLEGGGGYLLHSAMRYFTFRLVHVLVGYIHHAPTLLMNSWKLINALPDRFNSPSFKKRIDFFSFENAFWMLLNPFDFEFLFCCSNVKSQSDRHCVTRNTIFDTYSNCILAKSFYLGEKNRLMANPMWVILVWLLDDRTKK
jgi:hypothetical protein